MFIKLKLNMKTVFDTHLHFHLRCFLGLFYIAVVMENCKVSLLDYGSFHISIKSYSDKISHTTSNSIKSLVLFFKVRKFELEGFTFCQDPCRLKLLGKRMKLSR